MSTNVFSLGGCIIWFVTYIPQIYKVYKTNEVKALSLTTFILLAIGTIFWFIHGILKKNIYISITSTLVLIMHLYILYKIIYKNNNYSEMT